MAKMLVGAAATAVMIVAVSPIQSAATSTSFSPSSVSWAHSGPGWPGRRSGEKHQGAPSRSGGRSTATVEITRAGPFVIKKGHLPANSGHAAHSLCSWPFGSRPSAGPAARETLSTTRDIPLERKWAMYRNLTLCLLAASALLECQAPNSSGGVEAVAGGPTCSDCRLELTLLATVNDAAFPGGAMGSFAQVQVNSDSTFLVLTDFSPINPGVYLADRKGSIHRRLW